MPNDFLEKTLEDIIFENKEVIHTRGLPAFKEHTFRQVILPSGKKIDILSFEVLSGSLYYDLYELKREHINVDAVSQAYGYCNEINCLTKGYFKAVEARIFMVGNRYEPIPLFDNMKIQVSVYQYSYDFNGIQFRYKPNEIPFEAHEHFSMGLWAFGTKELSFTNGQGATVNFHDGYSRYIASEPSFHEKIQRKRQEAVLIRTILQIPAPPVTKPNPTKIERDEIMEEIMATNDPFNWVSVELINSMLPPLAWSPEFAKTIPEDKYMFDLELVEPEEIDCDLEPDYDNEPDDFEEEWDEGDDETDEPNLPERQVDYGPDRHNANYWFLLGLKD